MGSKEGEPVLLLGRHSQCLSNWLLKKICVHSKRALIDDKARSMCLLCQTTFCVESQTGGSFFRVCDNGDSWSNPSQESWSSPSVGKEAGLGGRKDDSNHTCLIYLVGPRIIPYFKYF